MIGVDYAHLRQSLQPPFRTHPFRIRGRGGADGIRHALRELMVCPMLHLPRRFESRRRSSHIDYRRNGHGHGRAQQASMEIRAEFKAGEHVVFGAHVDENMGDRVQITVLSHRFGSRSARREHL